MSMIGLRMFALFVSKMHPFCTCRTPDECERVRQRATVAALVVVVNVDAEVEIQMLMFVALESLVFAV